MEQNQQILASLITSFLAYFSSGTIVMLTVPIEAYLNSKAIPSFPGDDLRCKFALSLADSFLRWLLAVIRLFRYLDSSKNVLPKAKSISRHSSRRYCLGQHQKGQFTVHSLAIESNFSSTELGHNITLWKFSSSATRALQSLRRLFVSRSYTFHFTYIRCW